MNRNGSPRQKAGYEFNDLDGECMVYSFAEAKALYLNETASLIWKLCDGRRTVGAIEDLLREAYPDASQLRDDVDAAFQVFLEQGVMELQ